MAHHTSLPDRILINNLALHTTLGASLWVRPDADKRKQPISISVSVPYSLDLAGRADTLADSVSYGTLCKAVERVASQEGRFSCAEDLAEEVVKDCFGQFPSIREMSITVRKPRALLHAKAAGVTVTRQRIIPTVGTFDSVFIEGLQLSTIIGLNPWERLENQLVNLNLTLLVPPWRRDVFPSGFDFHALSNKVSDHVLESSYQTVESLATAVARVSLSYGPEVHSVTVRVAKPSALMFAASAEVEITRTPEDFKQEEHSLPAVVDQRKRHCAAIALGSNLGDRCGNIERALRELEASGVADIIDTSFLYETAAMYVEDQPKFLNAACLVDTSLEPGPLLSLLKKIESSVGRTATFTNGPRVVDLDIIFYDDMVTHLEKSTDNEFELILPHPRVQEREFVLRPLADIIPDFVHPGSRQSIQTLLSSVASPTPSMYRVISFPSPTSSEKNIFTTWPWPLRTYIMAIINSTPDSFSDGGVHFLTASSATYEYQASIVLSSVKQAVTDGADIIDIGGYSTRPGAAEVSEEEELARVVPLIRLLRSNGIGLPISIDTFRARVAREAVAAGANCVNDVYALSRDPEMLQAVKELAVPVVMMHSRGDAGKEKEYPNGVMQGVREELGEKVGRALRAGVRRWNVIADPGVGFSKDVTGNLAILRDLPQFTNSGSALDSTRHPLDSLPVLVGPSRKRFLGQLAKVEDPAARDYATAAACAAAVQGGADILRVHDVRGSRDVARVSDALWRRSPDDAESRQSVGQP